MTDTDLIARVAEKLGWKPCEPHIGMVWKNKDGDYEDAEDLLLNTDACLALLVGDKPDSMDYISLEFMGNWRVHMSCSLKTGN